MSCPPSFVLTSSFRELKYHVGLIAFHSKRKDCVIQEIFVSLIMYNFSMLITENITIDDDKHNDYRYKINYAFAIHICIKFFRSAHANPLLVEELIARNKCPVRPDRIADRKIVAILLSASITGYHNYLLMQSFFRQISYLSFRHAILANVIAGVCLVIFPTYSSSFSVFG